MKDEKGTTAARAPEGQGGQHGRERGKEPGMQSPAAYGPADVPGPAGRPAQDARAAARRVDVRPFAPGDEDDLLARGLRAGDVLEAWKVTGMRADAAVRLSVERALTAGVICVENRVAALFGLGNSRRGGSGIPWMVAHPDFENPAVAVPMARIMRRFLDYWLTVFPRLENYADPDHAHALKVLRWAGFTVENTPLRGPLGHELVYFWRTQCA